MLAELTYLADAGYLVAIAEYRGSEQAQFPAQLLDVKTAVRFLRAHAEKYRIDPAQFCSMGKSTPFAGQTVYGRCVRNVCGGAVVWQDAQV